MSDAGLPSVEPVLGAVWVRPRVQARYPRMGPLDVAVWRACVAQDLVPGDWVAYDVLLGGGRTPPRGMDPDEARVYRLLTQLRADVCVRAGRTVWACEVKPAVDVTAVGQAIAYATLANDALPACWNVVPTIATWECDDDFRAICDAQGILVWQADVERARSEDRSAGYPRTVSAGDVLHALGC